MRVSYLTCVVNKLSGYEVGSKLELVEHLTVEGVGLGMAGNRSAACGELYNGVVIVGFVVDGLSRAVCGSDHLLGHLTLSIVEILNGIDDDLGGYDLAIELDIRLGCANDSAFLILIIILLFARNVNRTDDITVAIVDTEKLRTSNEVRRKHC